MHKKQRTLNTQKKNTTTKKSGFSPKRKNTHGKLVCVNMFISHEEKAN